MHQPSANAELERAQARPDLLTHGIDRAGSQCQPAYGGFRPAKRSAERELKWSRYLTQGRHEHLGTYRLRELPSNGVSLLRQSRD